MEHLGFIRDMIDVKVLILFVASRLEYPVDVQQLYELCYQDESVSYFDVCTAVPEMVESGHLTKTQDGRYLITDKGREQGEATESSIAYTLRTRAESAVKRYNRKVHRSSFVKTEILDRGNGEFAARVTLDDEKGNLMALELMAPDKPQARYLEKGFQEKAEILYNMLMTELLDET